MTIGYLDSSYLDDIADAIREKTGDSASLSVGDMPDAIASISGGGDVDMAELFYKLFQQGSTAGATVDRTTFSRANTLNMTSIRPYAFYQMGLIGNFDATFANVTSVYQYAFYGSSVHEITFEKAITQVGSGYEFSNCSRLVAVNVPENGLRLSESMFRYDSSLAALPNIRVGSGNTLIPTYAFADCTALTSAVIPEGIETINSSAFYGCTHLEDITFPSTLRTLGGQSLSRTGLHELTIPATVTSLGNNGPAQECTQLEKITFLHTGNLPQRACYGNTSLTTVDWTPTGSGTIYVDSTNSGYSVPFYKCPSLTAWIIRSSTPPTLRGTYLWSASGNATQGAWPANAYIYVPDDAVETYKAATNWVTFADYIKPLSELPTT